MKSMKKALAANKVIGSLKKRASVAPETPSADNTAAPRTSKNQSLETTAHNSVKAFCESGGSVQGDEILFLPPIVDAAESSPAAAAECARVIRKFLDKQYYSRPSWQYNALMLIRILTDNPGETFTRNLDAEFAETCRKLLKHGRDSRVDQMLMDTLDDFQHTRMYDPNLQPLVQMWKAQKELALKKHGDQPPPPNMQPRTINAPPFNPHSQNYFVRDQRAGRLPEPAELASRLEEARTSAKLLEQVVMNTPPAETLGSELIKEFADRCQSASRSIQAYMACDNPAPDNETMESLIDTNEQLQTALNQHRRAVLNAKKQMGLNEQGPSEPTMTPATNGQDRVLEWQQTQAQLYASGEQPESPDLPARPVGNGKGKETDTYNQAGGSGAGPSGSGQRHQDDEEVLEDPFRDPQPEESNRRHQYEPFNPGFHSVDGPAGGHAATSSADAGGAGRAPTKDNASDDDDIYDAEAKNKQPVYRY